MICHVYVLVQHFQNTPLPTDVYLVDCPIAASIRLTEQPDMVGAAAKKKDTQPIQLPHFTGVCTEKNVETHNNGASLSQTCKILSHSSLAPSSLIYILIHHVTFYGDKIHTFLTFTQSHSASYWTKILSHLHNQFL